MASDRAAAWFAFLERNGYQPRPLDEGDAWFNTILMSASGAALQVLFPAEDPHVVIVAVGMNLAQPEPELHVLRVINGLNAEATGVKVFRDPEGSTVAFNLEFISRDPPPAEAFGAALDTLALAMEAFTERLLIPGGLPPLA